MTFDTRYISGLAWTDDGREILLSSGSLESPSLWRVAADGSGNPQRLTSLGSGVSYPAIARHGRHLAYTRSSFDSNIWRVEAPDVHGGRRTPAPFITSTRVDDSPDFSSDGKRIAFSSGRSSREGKHEIWVCDSDGSNPVQLTSLDAFSGTPHWSPDGERIAFDSDVGGKWAIFVVSSNGGNPKRMTSAAANDDAPRWSRDGKWIYFVSDRNGADQVWKMPAEGGESVQVTKKGGTEAAESFDGKTLYYAKGRFDTSLWKVPAGGGEETQVLESLVYAGNFAVVNSGIYFRPTPHSLEFFSFATGKISSIVTSEKLMGAGLTISPDRRWILYTQIDQSATELMLVENFR
jgi:Tol biopolymer transport system component